jgi:hypothetical protein
VNCSPLSYNTPGTTTTTHPKGKKKFSFSSLTYLAVFLLGCADLEGKEGKHEHCPCSDAQRKIVESCQQQQQPPFSVPAAAPSRNQLILISVASLIIQPLQQQQPPPTKFIRVGRRPGSSPNSISPP